MAVNGGEVAVKLHNMSEALIAAVVTRFRAPRTTRSCTDSDMDRHIRLLARLRTPVAYTGTL